MAGWNGSGNFVRAYTWVNERDAGNNIDATKFDAENDAFKDGIENCIAKDGQNQATSDLPMGGNKHTGVGDGSASNHYAALGQVQTGEAIYAGSTSGTNTLTATLSPAPTAYTAGMVVSFFAGNSNSTATTINLNSLGAKDVYAGGAACVGGEIIQGETYIIVYDGTVFNIVGPQNLACAFRVVQSGAQSIGNASITQVTSFDTESYDFGGNFAANAFTAPVDGVYHLSAGGIFAANSTGDRLLYLISGGTRIAQMTVPASTSPVSTNLCVAADFLLAASATVEAYVYQDSGGNLNFGTVGTFFAGHLIRRY